MSLLGHLVLVTLVVTSQQDKTEAGRRLPYSFEVWKSGIPELPVPLFFGEEVIVWGGCLLRVPGVS